MDTIFALSSGVVPSGVAVIRISGPSTAAALQAVCGSLPEPRRAALKLLTRPADHAPLDRALVLWFPNPASYTGEDVAELHLHGGRAVVESVFEALASLRCRLAAPGEFSRRAFHNGKLDLTQIEGLADLIAAETEYQRRQAFEQARGGLRAQAEAWRDRLLDLRAEIEARLDFSDEGDVGENLPPAFWAEVAALRTELHGLLAQAKSGERIRDGFTVAILGRPNAGKSSLLNSLARRDVAIVTEEAGTTRDVLEVHLNLCGYPVVLLDTAGLRESETLAEREGVGRAERAAKSADLVLWLQDCREAFESLPIGSDAPIWRVTTKIDLLAKQACSDDGISAVTSIGIPELVEKIRQAASSAMGRGDALITRARQREAMADAAAALENIDGVSQEIAADLLRSASDAIGRLSGRVGVEDVLDRLFAEFCIGK